MKSRLRVCFKLTLLTNPALSLALCNLNAMIAIIISECSESLSVFCSKFKRLQIILSSLVCSQQGSGYEKILDVK